MGKTEDCSIFGCILRSPYSWKLPSLRDRIDEQLEPIGAATLAWDVSLSVSSPTT